MWDVLFVVLPRDAWCLSSQRSRRMDLCTFPVGPCRKQFLDIATLASEFVAAPFFHRYIYMVVAIDYYSKWPEVTACLYVTSVFVIDFLNHLFEQFGLVEEIVADNGTPLTSVEFEKYLKALGIWHSLAVLYSPQASNPEVKRFNRVVKEGLRSCLADVNSSSLLFITSCPLTERHHKERRVSRRPL